MANTNETPKKRGRPKGAKNKLVKGIPISELNPPPLHEKGTPWTEEQAKAECEFLVRYLSCPDHTKLFIATCAHERGYSSNIYNDLIKIYPDTCRPIVEYAKELQSEKLAMGALTKAYEPRFAQFAMMNISDWRTKERSDQNATIVINAGDYKGVSPSDNADKIQVIKGAK